MLTIQQIINEADISLLNEFSVSDKVSWLNDLNGDFFNTVKIPQTSFFSSTAGQSSYTLSGAELREKNMDKVIVGRLKYESLNYQDVQPVHNWFVFDDSSKILTLSSPPSKSGIQCVARYHRIGTTTFTVGSVSTQRPDAPPEYHYIYVLGLLKYIAESLNDLEQAANYASQYRQALNVAAQNYQGRDVV